MDVNDNRERREEKRRMAEYILKAQIASTIDTSRWIVLISIKE